MVVKTRIGLLERGEELMGGEGLLDRPRLKQWRTWKDDGGASVVNRSSKDRRNVGAWSGAGCRTFEGRSSWTC